MSRKNKVLIKREDGGIGDILMHRMLFKDLKKFFEKSELTFAIPKKYIPLVSDHPYIDKVVAVECVDKSDYDETFNTLGKAGAYEFSKIPFIDKHRSDIWASYFKMKVTDRDGYLNFSDEEENFAKDFFANYEDKCYVGVAPVSAYESKDWEREKFQELINRLREKGCECFVFHDKSLKYKNAEDVNVGLREWMALTSKLDIVVTVATSTFNLANLLHKPTVAIFGAEDLSVYGKYFPEMIPVQRTRAESEFPFCPCWSSLDCKLREPGLRKRYPPECLKSISVDEVYNKVLLLTEAII